MDEELDQTPNLAILEESGVAFDPTTQHLDLSKDEKRRVTSLMLAIQAYRNLLIPDAVYLEKAADLARRGEGPVILPATIDGTVVAAIKFDNFISGSNTTLPTSQEMGSDKE